MTRGRRDGILKSEKVRHVVKIGPMHLKGVWIPFERALDLANKHNLTNILYPLFVHNIGSLVSQRAEEGPSDKKTSDEKFWDDMNFPLNQSSIVTDVDMDSYLEETPLSQPPTDLGDNLRNYQMQLMLLEQQNKRRMLTTGKVSYDPQEGV